MPILLDSTTPESARDTWCTPPWLLDLIRSFKPIGFDPCPNEHDFVRPIGHTQGRDGLEMRWAGNGLVFVNPPYSRGNFMKFCRKAALEALEGAEIIMLVPANLETKPWQLFLWQADAWCFPKKRVNFYANGVERRGVNFASALAYFGHDSERFCHHFSELGRCLPNNRLRLL